MIPLAPWVVGLVVGLANIVITVSVMIWRFSARFAVLEEKVDTIWSFLMKRALAEALNKGWVTRSSPVTLSHAAQVALEPITQELWEFYDKRVQALSYADLLLAIECRFGAWLMEHICVPYGLTSGGCLVAVAALLRPGAS